MRSLVSLSWFCLVLCMGISGAVADGVWFASSGGQEKQWLTPGEDGVVSTQVGLPGSALIFYSKDRRLMRADKSDFNKESLTLEVMIESDSDAAVRGNLFIKDKDGYWFQDRAGVYIVPGEWQKLSVRLPAAYKELRPEGHQAAWSSLFLANMHTAGLSLYGEEERRLKVSCRNLRLEGERVRPALKVVDLNMPAACGRYELMRGTFELTREYFNPFDPDEIRIDVEAQLPDGSTITWPAFFNQDYTRRQHFTTEINTPLGSPFWEFRFAPAQIGEYTLRLNITDNSAPEKTTLSTPWRRLKVRQSGEKGFVRIHDDKYFEFDNGEFFYPVGMNIHTNKDLRSERVFNFGHLADLGVYDYVNYFDAMAENGMNACEVWMAAWTFALEWTSSLRGYYGLGRYSLKNASRLDFVLNYARRKGIYVNLVLDNHGKLSAQSDPEWDDSPFNLANPFAVADGALLKQPQDFFTDPEALRYNRNRNRYIAARWGAFTNIMYIELWSEVDLVTGFNEIYNDDKLIKWHTDTFREFKAMNPGRHIMTTHVCGHYNRNLQRPKIAREPELDIVVGDAYRKTQIAFYDHMSVHGLSLKQFGKPVMITEFGGTSQGSDGNRVVADIHSGLWASMFKHQAGAPFLWWHDFIHRHNHYQHYQGYTRFVSDIDPRGRNLVSRDLLVVSSDLIAAPGAYAVYSSPSSPLSEKDAHGFYNLPAPQNILAMAAVPFNSPLDPAGRYALFRCFSMGNASEVYGWVFCTPLLFVFPDAQEKLPEYNMLYLMLDHPLEKGAYIAEFFDTMSGKLISVQEFSINERERNTHIKLPPFSIDLGFKIRRKSIR